MNATTVPRLLRASEVIAARGDSRSSLYRDIKAGLFTPPIRIGEASSAWPDYEAAAINLARIAGKSKEEIRTLVRELFAARKSAA